MQPRLTKSRGDSGSGGGGGGSELPASPSGGAAEAGGWGAGGKQLARSAASMRASPEAANCAASGPCTSRATNA